LTAAIVHLAHRDVALTGGITSAIARDRSVQETHGLALPVGVVVWKRFQLRLSCVVHQGRNGSGQGVYNYGRPKFPSEEAPGASVFYKDKTGGIFHTYSTYARGLDILLGTYNLLDLTPKGRDEEGLKSSMAWLRHHDKYADGRIGRPELFGQQRSYKMIKMLEPMSGEIEQEAATTRRVLERVPEDKLTWKPHPRSMSLGQLAMHVATIPGGICKLAQVDEFEVNPANFNPPVPEEFREILAALDASVQAAQEYLGGVSESSAMGMWRAKVNGKEVMAMPRSRHAPSPHAQPLVSPSRSIIGVPAIAGSSSSVDLWAQARMKIRLPKRSEPSGGWLPTRCW
jgi:hypothetical protein